jgi:prophage regulatory protein
MPETILRRPEVLARTGLSNTSVHRGIRAGTFPRPVTLGRRAVGWRESDIIKWIESLATKPARAS